MKIHFELDDQSKYAYNVLKYYWLNDEGIFIAKVVDLRRKHNMGSVEYNSFIASAKCHIDFGTCCSCKNKNLHLVRNRTNATEVFQNQYYHHFCFECRKKAENFCSNLDIYQSKVIWMKLSFKYKLWERLEKDELNFLKSLSLLRREWNRIYYEIISLDPNKYFKILFKLDSMNLINYRQEADWKNKINILEDLNYLIKEKLI